MDIDLALLRSFVLTAEQMHFGAAADDLHVTQQALSKRIRRLEDALAVQLFVRSSRSVALTPAGRRFLPGARQILAAADSALLDLHAAAPLLRIDVLDDRLGSMALLNRALADHPELGVEVSMRRGLRAAMGALERGEIDAALGRVRDLGRDWPATLDHRVVRLEPLSVLVGEEHPLAGRAVLTPADLREVGFWVPDPGSAVEWEAYLARFARHFAIPLSHEPAAATLSELSARIRASRAEVTLIGADMPPPAETGLRTIPLVDPTPAYPWSLVWPRHERALAVTLLPALLDAGAMCESARARLWLPEGDCPA